MSIARAPMLLKLLFAAALVAIGWQVIVTTAADNFAATAPRAALSWVPDHSGALVELAQQQLDDATVEPDPATIADLAERSLERNPLEIDALRILALVAEARDQTARAEALMGLAAQRSQQDVRVLAWMMDKYLSEGDIGGALRQTDRILRISAEMRPDLFPMLASLAEFPEGLEPLAKILQDNPPWRGWFTTSLLSEAEDVEVMQAFYAALGGEGLAPDPQEVRAYLTRLVQLGRYRLAYDAWAALPANRTAAAPSLIRNGDFEQPATGLPFDWNLADVRGAKARIVADSSGNRKLTVEFHDTEVAFRHVSQLLLLQPGRYRLEGEAQLADLKSERGLQWIIACAGQRDRVIGETDRMKGTIVWSRFAAVFDVPADAACEAQTLTLVLAARIPAERQVSGAASFDSLRISPV